MLSTLAQNLKHNKCLIIVGSIIVFLTVLGSRRTKAWPVHDLLPFSAADSAFNASLRVTSPSWPQGPLLPESSFSQEPDLGGVILGGRPGFHLGPAVNLPCILGRS